MQPEARFATIEAILQAIAERMEQAERRMDRADQRMEKVDRRMEKFDERMDRAELRMDRAERRMEKFDYRLEVTRKLVQAGMKLVIQNNALLKEFQRAQAAFLDSLRKGGRQRTPALTAIAVRSPSPARAYLRYLRSAPTKVSASAFHGFPDSARSKSAPPDPGSENLRSRVRDRNPHKALRPRPPANSIAFRQK
jgi:hypothetical protein